MRVNALASGSSGNAYVIRFGETALLVEAGLPASRLTEYLRSVGQDPRQLSGILLTHAHGDHSRGARQLARMFQIPVFATSGTLHRAGLDDLDLACAIPPDRPWSIGGVEVVACPVPHDCAEPVAFHLAGEGSAVCVVTDLGHAPDYLPALLAGADLVILEANHDQRLLWEGPYPPALKRRVGGPHGHLSNIAAARCLIALRPAPPREVWLAHLSRVNNRVAVALATVRCALVAAGLGQVRVAVARRDRPSLEWRARAAEQLALF